VGDEKFRSLQRERLECLKMKEDNETVNSAKGLRVSNVVGKTTIDKAMCRLIKKGLMKRQKGKGVRTYGSPYKGHVDRR